MKYINADIILPEELLKEVQKYVQGGWCISRNLKGYARNGEKTRAPGVFEKRNLEIRQLFASGATIDQLSSQFCLSCDSIKKLFIPKQVTESHIGTDSDVAFLMYKSHFKPIVI